MIIIIIQTWREYYLFYIIFKIIGSETHGKSGYLGGVDGGVAIGPTAMGSSQ